MTLRHYILGTVFLAGLSMGSNLAEARCEFYAKERVERKQNGRHALDRYALKGQLLELESKICVLTEHVDVEYFYVDGEPNYPGLLDSLKHFLGDHLGYVVNDKVKVPGIGFCSYVGQNFPRLSIDRFDGSKARLSFTYNGGSRKGVVENLDSLLASLSPSKHSTTAHTRAVKILSQLIPPKCKIINSYDNDMENIEENSKDLGVLK